MSPEQPPWWVRSIQAAIERLGLPTMLVVGLLVFLYFFVTRDVRALGQDHKDVLQTQAQHQREMQTLMLDVQVNNRLLNAQIERMVRLAQLQCVYLATTNPQRAACLSVGADGK